METKAQEPEVCPKCGIKDIIGTPSHCPSCQQDMGPCNVRRVQTEANLDALDNRYLNVLDELKKLNLIPEHDDIYAHLEENSCVVVAMRACTAVGFFANPSTMYAGYETLVAGEMRMPAKEQDDLLRCMVAGKLFGSFASEIRYGALSTNGKGLPSYGEIFCKLKSIAIAHRTTFLERNSYEFFKLHDLNASNGLPLGYTCCWEQKAKLAVVKLGEQIISGMDRNSFQDILLKSNGNRSDDDFIEAHIFRSFNIQAVEAVDSVDLSTVDNDQKIDIQLALSKFPRRSP